MSNVVATSMILQSLECTSLKTHWQQTYRRSSFYVGWIRGTVVCDSSLSPPAANTARNWGPEMQHFFLSFLPHHFWNYTETELWFLCCRLQCASGYEEADYCVIICGVCNCILAVLWPGNIINPVKESRKILWVTPPCRYPLDIELCITWKKSYHSLLNNISVCAALPWMYCERPLQSDSCSPCIRVLARRTCSPSSLSSSISTATASSDSSIYEGQISSTWAQEQILLLQRLLVHAPS